MTPQPTPAHRPARHRRATPRTDLRRSALVLAAVALPLGGALPAQAAPALETAPTEAFTRTVPLQPRTPAAPVTPTAPRPAAPVVLPATPSVAYTVDVAVGNVRKGPGMSQSVVGSVSRGTRLTGTVVNGWLKIGNDRYVGLSILNGGSAASTPPSTPKVTRYVTASVGNVRSGPGLANRVVGTLTRDTKVTGTVTNGWVEIGNGRYVSGVILTSTPPRGSTAPSRGSNDVTRYVTATTAGNVRSGPSTSNPVVTSLSRGTKVTGSLGNGWLNLGGGRFISSAVLGTSDPSSAPDPGPGGSVSGQAVLDVAQRYTGIMYRWGGTTPAGFDCSGYTQFVFAQLGVSLPRTVAQQRAATTPVSSPRPGDLVFWGVGHMAIYAGDGQIYDSGRPGLPTQKRNMFSGVTGFGRVG